MKKCRKAIIFSGKASRLIKFTFFCIDHSTQSHEVLLLKGFIDRVFQPGWAFNALPKGRPEGLLAGRSARLLVTMDAPGWFDRWFYGASARRSMQRATLWYTGFSPVRTRIFPEVLHSSAQTRARWMERVATDAASDVQKRGARAS